MTIPDLDEATLSRFLEAERAQEMAIRSSLETRLVATTAIQGAAVAAAVAVIALLAEPTREALNSALLVVAGVLLAVSMVASVVGLAPGNFSAIGIAELRSLLNREKSFDWSTEILADIESLRRSSGRRGDALFVSLVALAIAIGLFGYTVVDALTN